MKWTSVTLTDTTVRVHGDAAILTGIETLRGSAKGYVTGPRRLTDVWVKRGGRRHHRGRARNHSRGRRVRARRRRAR
jgi:uncharacterized protein DUF4440